MNTIRFLCAVTAVAATFLAGCAQRTVVDPDGLTTIRTYRFAGTVSDPQPHWNPVGDAIVARTREGFAILQEGRGRQEFFTSQENRQTWFPVWINRDQFVFGPQRNTLTLADGQVAAASDGLTLVNVTDNGISCSIRRQSFSKVGFHPRPGRGGIYAQVGQTMILIDANGETADAGNGFYPEPQRDGPGVAWQETPVFEADRWTSSPARGRLFIRWKPGVISEVPGGCQARWTSDGGIVCTVLRGDPSTGGAWYAGGTDVVYLEGPAATPRIVARDARDPDPHPREPLLAVSDSSSGVRVVSIREGCAVDRLFAVSGINPQWNHDGTRLLLLEPHGDAPAEMIVHVLREDRSPVTDGH